LVRKDKLLAKPLFVLSLESAIINAVRSRAMKQAASLLLAASFAAASLPTWVVQPGKKTHFCFANTWPSGLQNILT